MSGQGRSAAAVAFLEDKWLHVRVAAATSHYWLHLHVRQCLWTYFVRFGVLGQARAIGRG